jgi:hypothetical protein
MIVGARKMATGGTSGGLKIIGSDDDDTERLADADADADDDNEIDGVIE